MRVYPINTNNNVNHKATIKPTKSLQEGFNIYERCTDSGCMKSLNSLKEFVDTLARIRESKKIREFKIEMDKSNPDCTKIKINGNIVSDGEKCQNLQEGYLVVEHTQKFASELEKAQPSILDNLKAEIEAKYAELDELKERYGQRLKAELEQAKKMIFENAE